MHRIQIILATAILLAAGHGQAASAASPQAAAVCAACHGPDGSRPIDANTPTIGGQYADYLAKVLQDYRSGARVNVVMNGQAANLSDQDIAQLAAWFASQPSPLKDLRDSEN
ncbi:MAG: cytochrome c [Lysobacterales bacterium]